VITQPSLSELLEGLAKTSEHVLLPALRGSSLVERVTEILMLLDRIEAEWPLSARFLVEDNLDIELTLSRVERAVGTRRSTDVVRQGGLGTGPDADRERQLSTVELAAHNRRLKEALVWTMEALDLPAAPSDPAETREADGEIVALLSRMLHREREAMPSTPPRVNPLSKGGDALDADATREMSAVLERFIAAEMPGAGEIRVTNLQRMAGGASREAFVFDAAWREGDEATTERCVMLRQPVSSVLESDESDSKITGSRRLPHIEFKMIKLMEQQGIPVPHMLWVDPDGKWLERPFSVARWIDGEADLSKLADEPNLPAILERYVEILAAVHTLDPAAAGVDFLGDPTEQTAAREQVDLFAHGFDKQRLEEFPAITYMIRWLRKNAPVAPRVSVIHGDFRLGNFMWDDAGIVAMLDWEQCHVGDPLEEIAFMYWPLWSLGSLVPIRELVERYERASGIAVDDAALAYYRVFIELKMCVVILTGIKSFYATPERQLMYGATTGFEMLRECQLRVVDALSGGGPTVEFGDDRR
jgi:aminoglycoside phosphotransferase (APT) family kinase protein